jgi:hypothetical protein
MERLRGPVDTSLVGPWLSAFVVSYTIGAELQGRRLGAGVAWLLALVAALALADPRSEHGGMNLVWGWLVVVAAPVLAARLLREPARLARALHAAASDEDDSPEWTGAAVAKERERIAGELHDVVVGALERMVVAAGAAALVAPEPGAHGAGLRRRRADRARRAVRDPQPARRAAPRGRRARAGAAAVARALVAPRLRWAAAATAWSACASASTCSAARVRTGRCPDGGFEVPVGEARR